MFFALTIRRAARRCAVPHASRSPLGSATRLVAGLLAMTLGLLATPGCKSPYASGNLEIAPEIVRSTQRFRREYVMAAGDTLRVAVRRMPELSLDCVVRSDGFISLPILDDVLAAGLTVPELDARLTTLLVPHVQEPDVTVIATTVRPPVVYVVGEVNQPTIPELRVATTAAQAIARAGGFNDTAARDSVMLLRLDADGYLYATRINLELEGQPAPWMALHNVALQPDDMLFVPKTSIAQVDIWVDQHINRPIGGVATLLSAYANLKLAQNIEDI
ncbi:MAG: polysaccharide biosynthesis/export family protein [Planctomycetota bacterium]